jgi:hypothetical protein
MGILFTRIKLEESVVLSALHSCATFNPLLDKCLYQRKQVFTYITCLEIKLWERSYQAVKFILLNKRAKILRQPRESIALRLKKTPSSLKKKEYLAYTPPTDRTNSTDALHSHAKLQAPHLQMKTALAAG